jgi:hypothetical protein
MTDEKTRAIEQAKQGLEREVRFWKNLLEQVEEDPAYVLRQIRAYESGDNEASVHGAHKARLRLKDILEPRTDGGYEPPGSEPWVVTLGVDPDDDLVVIAISENVDLDGVDAVEHRFFPVHASNEVEEEGTDAGASPVLVYAGGTIHSCKNEGGPDECPVYSPPAFEEVDAAVNRQGTATVEDLPAEVRDHVADALGMTLLDPSEVENPTTERVEPDELGIPGYGLNPEEREPRGYW